MSSSTQKDRMCLSLSMSGCTCLLQVSPIDTRCTGLPILARVCLVSEKRDCGLGALSLGLCQEPVCRRNCPGLSVS